VACLVIIGVLADGRKQVVALSPLRRRPVTHLQRKMLMVRRFVHSYPDYRPLVPPLPSPYHPLWFLSPLLLFGKDSSQEAWPR